MPSSIPALSARPLSKGQVQGMWPDWPKGNYGGFFGWPNFTARHVGGFMGMPATDVRGEFRVIDIYRRAGG